MSPILHSMPAPPLTSTGRERLIAAGPDLWRVADARGRVIGHLQTVLTPEGRRYRARRYHRPTGRLRDVGDFWSPDDAVACLRYAT